MTHTYALLEVPADVVTLIKQKLIVAGYGHAIERDRPGNEVIDMHGIALIREDRDDKTLETCRRRFDNTTRFTGEPMTPVDGWDKL